VPCGRGGVSASGAETWAGFPGRRGSRGCQARLTPGESWARNYRRVSDAFEILALELGRALALEILLGAERVVACADIKDQF